MIWIIRLKPGTNEFVLDDTGDCPFSLAPLMAKSRMGDYRVATTQCPQALYFALNDILNTGGSGFKEDDEFVFNGRILLVVTRNPVRNQPNPLVIVPLMVIWLSVFGDRAFSDGSVKGVPETELALDPRCVGEELNQ